MFTISATSTDINTRTFTGVCTVNGTMDSDSDYTSMVDMTFIEEGSHERAEQACSECDLVACSYCGQSYNVISREGAREVQVYTREYYFCHHRCEFLIRQEWEDGQLPLEKRIQQLTALIKESWEGVTAAGETIQRITESMTLKPTMDCLQLLEMEMERQRRYVSYVRRQIVRLNEMAKCQ